MVSTVSIVKGITIRVYSHSLVKEIAIKNELTLYFFFSF
jgi:hypothetical protein